MSVKSMGGWIEFLDIVLMAVLIAKANIDEYY